LQNNKIGIAIKHDSIATCEMLTEKSIIIVLKFMYINCNVLFYTSKPQAYCNVKLQIIIIIIIIKVMYNCPVITPIYFTNYKKILLTLYVKTKAGNSVASQNSQILHKSTEVVTARKVFTVDHYFRNNYVLSIIYSVDYLIKHCKDLSLRTSNTILKSKMIGD